MSMYFKKTIIAILSVVFVLFSTITVFAEDGIQINAKANAKVGDKITYSLYLADCTEGIVGGQMYVYYDKDYLQIDTDSAKYEVLDGVVDNLNCDGYITFNWSNIMEYADFSKKAGLISLDFTVIKDGAADIRFFVQDLYGEDMTYIKSYTFTYDLLINGKSSISQEPPLIVEDSDILNNRQGSFINYLDGMGEENTPNKDHHRAVRGDINAGTQKITKTSDVTKNTGNLSDSNTILILVASIAIICAIVIIAILKKKDSQKEIVVTDVPQEKN